MQHPDITHAERTGHSRKVWHKKMAQKRATNKTYYEDYYTGFEEEYQDE